MSTDNNTPKRTIKKKFLAADKTGRAIKGVGGYIGSAIGGAILAMGSKSKEDEEEENEDNDG